MGLFNKYLTSFTAVVGALLALGMVYVHRLPAVNSEMFSKQAADISQTPYKSLERGQVVKASEPQLENFRQYSSFRQELEVKFLSGEETGKLVSVLYEDKLLKSSRQEIKVGQKIVVGKIGEAENAEYVLVDRYRLPVLGVFAGLFFVCAVWLGRARGFAAVLGLLLSLGILILYLAPNLLSGKNSILVTFTGAGSIAFLSMYLAHGFKHKTSVAILSILISLIIAQTLSYLFVRYGFLMGAGTQEAYFLNAGFLDSINLQGLLLSGILIGALGILDDVTMAQVATVKELYETKPDLSFKELFNRANNVGKEHIASLVNTLVLAYAGASLPLFLLLYLNAKQALWPVLNSEFLAEEIVRTLSGSLALILAVPISTFLAVYFYKSKPVLREPIDN